MRKLFIFLFLFLFIPVFTYGATYTHSPEVKLFNPASGKVQYSFLAYHKDFKGGVNVDTGDINGDNISEIITGAGQGGGPHVRIFTKSGRDTGFNFFPFHPNFRGGVDVAFCDINGDNKDEIVTSQQSNGQAWIKLYRRNYSIISTFLAYPPQFEGGANIACGDVNGDGIDEIITGAGKGGGPHIRVFNRHGHALSPDFFPYPKSFRGGINIATSDIDLDGRDEILVSPNSNATSRAKIYNFDRKRSIVSEFNTYRDSFQGGSSIAAGDVINRHYHEIITGPNTPGSSHIRLHGKLGNNLGRDFYAYNKDFKGGIDIAVIPKSNFEPSSIVVAPKRGRSITTNPHQIIGKSVEGRNIDAYFFGSGSNKTLYIGGTHGSESNTVDLMNIWRSHLSKFPGVIPTDSQIIIIPNHNPDGTSKNERRNAHGIDLNRNFATNNWQPWGILWNTRIAAGPYPMSEIENQTIENFIDKEQPDKIITYHANANTIFVPKESGKFHSKSLELAKSYNNISHYPGNYDWPHYSLTGSLDTWSAYKKNIPSFTVELSNYSDWQQNIPAMIYVANQK